MRILYFSVIRQHEGWGAEWFLNNAFEGLGHETICVDYRERRHRLAAAVRDCPPVDALLVQRGDRFPLELVRAARVPCLFLATELVSRRDDQHALMQWEALGHLFVRTQECIDEVVGRGWQPREKVSVLLSSFDPALHRKLPDVAERDIDLLFLGGMTERRRRIIDGLPDDLNVVEVKAFGEEMVRWFNRAKIVLNIHAEQQLDVETRIYEALGSGAFVVSEKLAAQNPFTDGQLVQIDEPAQLEPVLRRYLADDVERERIARAGYAAAMSAHSYRHRAEQIVAEIERLAGGAEPRAPFGRDAAWLRLRAAEGGRRVAAAFMRLLRSA